MKIIGFSGSLRKDSFNTKILNTLKNLMPKDVDFEIIDISNIPMYNEDLEQNNLPEINNLKEKIKNADAIIFATPEYNYTTSAVLKNIIDWASRPYGDNSWDSKLVAIISSSPGSLGGVRALSRLKQILVNVNMHPINKPEVVIPEVQKKFNEKGELTDTHTKDKLKELINELITWAKRIKT